MSLVGALPSGAGPDDGIETEYRARLETIASRRGCESQFSFSMFGKSVALGAGLVFVPSVTAATMFGPMQVAHVMGATALGAAIGPFVFYSALQTEGAARAKNEDEWTASDIERFFGIYAGEEEAMQLFQLAFEYRFFGTDAGANRSRGLQGERRPAPDVRNIFAEFKQDLYRMSTRELPTRPYEAALNFVLRHFEKNPND